MLEPTFSIWDEYEEQGIRPVKICTGVIGAVPNFEIRCNLERDQLKNKNLIVNIFEILKKAGILNVRQK